MGARAGDQRVTVEVLYSDGCPNHETLLPHLRELLVSASVDSEVALRRVESAEIAETECFLGLPSVRVNGHDVDPGAAERTDYGLKCRLYATEAGFGGAPPDQWILDALHRATAPERTAHIRKEVNR